MRKILIGIVVIITILFTCYSVIMTSKGCVDDKDREIIPDFGGIHNQEPSSNITTWIAAKPFNCSRYTVDKKYETVQDMSMIWGCIMKEFHESDEELTNKILNRYNITVDYTGFDINTIERESILLNNTQPLTIKQTSSSPLFRNTPENETENLNLTMDSISIIGFANHKLVNKTLLCNRWTCYFPETLVHLGNDTYGMKLYPEIKEVWE